MLTRRYLLAFGLFGVVACSSDKEYIYPDGRSTTERVSQAEGSNNDGESSTTASQNAWGAKNQFLRNFGESPLFARGDQVALEELEAADYRLIEIGFTAYGRFRVSDAALDPVFVDQGFRRLLKEAGKLNKDDKMNWRQNTSAKRLNLDSFLEKFYSLNLRVPLALEIVRSQVKRNDEHLLQLTWSGRASDDSKPTLKFSKSNERLAFDFLEVISLEPKVLTPRVAAVSQLGRKRDGESFGLVSLSRLSELEPYRSLGKSVLAATFVWSEAPVAATAEDDSVAYLYELVFEKI